MTKSERILRLERLHHRMSDVLLAAPPGRLTTKKELEEGFEALGEEIEDMKAEYRVLGDLPYVVDAA